MPYGYSEYLGRSDQLLAAARQLREAFEQPETARELAVQDLVAAARPDTGKGLVMHYAPAAVTAAAPATAAKPDDALSAVLLDLQSANLLLSAGLALEEAGTRGQVNLFDQAVQQVEGSQTDVTEALAKQKMAFAAAAAVHSETVEAATQTFQSTSGAVLTDFVDEAAAVVNSVLDELKKLDPDKVLEALDKLGQSVQVAAAAGRLLRQGIEKFKNAIEALSQLFGAKAVAAVKDKVAEIWKKFKAGEYTKQALAGVFDIGGATAHIQQVLHRPDLDRDAVDRASNALEPLAADYRRNLKLLQGLAAAIGLAAVILGFLHAALPWLPLALAAAYAGVIAGTVLIGTEYCGSGRVLQWVRGVTQIADGIRPA